MKYVSRITYGVMDYSHYQVMLDSSVDKRDIHVEISDTESDMVMRCSCFNRDILFSVKGVEFGFKSVKLWRYKPEFLELKKYIKCIERVKNLGYNSIIGYITVIDGDLGLDFDQYIDCKDSEWAFEYENVPTCLADYLINYADSPSDFAEDLSYAYIILSESGIYKINLDTRAKSLLAKLRLMRSKQ